MEAPKTITLEDGQIIELNNAGIAAYKVGATVHQSKIKLGKFAGFAAANITRVVTAHRAWDKTGFIQESIEEGINSVLDPIKQREQAMKNLRIVASSGNLGKGNFNNRQEIFAALINLGLDESEANAEVNRILSNKVEEKP